jgi:N-formylglutamate deformylase
MDVFKVIEPSKDKVPFILSIPHSGTNIPNDKLNFFDKEQLKLKDDTDWYLDQLYDFAPKLGITTIKANFSRWLVDLNRNPENKPLYNDGRIITSVCPTTNFNGKPIYIENYKIDELEMSQRIDSYFLPYHSYIDSLIKNLIEKFPAVIIWDAHSIKRNVPTIYSQSFPDLIIGNNDDKSCNKKLTEIVHKQIIKSELNITKNHPFKGGYITRSFGFPKKNINAIQLEMSKDLYMSENETKYDSEKADIIKKILKKTFVEIIKNL